MFNSLSNIKKINKIICLLYLIIFVNNNINNNVSKKELVNFISQSGGSSWGLNGALLRNEILKDYFASVPDLPYESTVTDNDLALTWLGTNLKTYFNRRFNGTPYYNNVLDTFFRGNPQSVVLRTLQPYEVDANKYSWSDEFFEDFMKSGEYKSGSELLEKYADEVAKDKVGKLKDLSRDMQAMSQRGGNFPVLPNSMNGVELRNNMLQAYSQTYTPLGVTSDEPSSEDYLLNDLKDHFQNNYDDISMI